MQAYTRWGLGPTNAFNSMNAVYVNTILGWASKPAAVTS